MEWSLISFNFVEWRTNPDRVHALAPNRAMSNARREVAERRRSLSVNGNVPQMGLARSFTATFINTNDLGLCPICSCDMDATKEDMGGVYTLGCQQMHLMHRECFDSYKMFNDKGGGQLKCPFCRVPVDMSKMRRVKFYDAKLKRVETCQEVEMHLKPAVELQPAADVVVE